MTTIRHTRQVFGCSPVRRDTAGEDIFFHRASRGVRVPFTPVLSAHMQLLGPWVRTAFRDIGEAIKAHAAANAGQRRVDDDGYIIAEIADYAAVYPSAQTDFAAKAAAHDAPWAIARAVVREAKRQGIPADGLCTVTFRALADGSRLPLSSIGAHVRTAERWGALTWVRGQTANLPSQFSVTAMARDMLDRGPRLPTGEDLQAAWTDGAAPTDGGEAW